MRPPPCSAVNKKALDQYTDFTERREELVARHAENKRGERRIRDLIATLDLRKDEAVERTFKVGASAPQAVYALGGRYCEALQGVDYLLASWGVCTFMGRKESVRSTQCKLWNARTSLKIVLYYSVYP